MDLFDDIFDKVSDAVSTAVEAVEEFGGIIVDSGQELGGIISDAAIEFIDKILSFDVDEKIDSDVASYELKNRIRDNLNSGNYSTVNIGLTAEVSDIKRRSKKTEVDFSVSCDDYDETCEVKMSSKYGTDLEVGDRLKLTL